MKWRKQMLETKQPYAKNWVNFDATLGIVFLACSCVWLSACECVCVCTCVHACERVFESVSTWVSVCVCQCHCDYVGVLTVCVRLFVWVCSCPCVYLAGLFG